MGGTGSIGGGFSPRTFDDLTEEEKQAFGKATGQALPLGVFQNPNVPGGTEQDNAAQNTNYSQDSYNQGEGGAGAERTADPTQENAIPGANRGASQTTISLNENERNVYVPGEFRNNPEAFKFDQSKAWSDLYGAQAAQHGGRADQAWANQGQARAGQAQAINDAWGRQGQMYGASDQATGRLAGTQDLVGSAAAGNGPSAAQSQFQRNLDQSISATRSALAGQRGLSRGAAARLGAQSVSELGLKSAADAAALRAQEQQAAMGLSANLNLGAQGQLGQQSATNLATTGNLANQLRTADTGLYGGEVNTQQLNQGMGLQMDQQNLQLKQQQEQADYNKWRDWNNWIVTQYGGAGNYTAPWQDQAWMNMGAGLVGGLAQGGVDWLSRAGGGATGTPVK